MSLSFQEIYHQIRASRYIGLSVNYTDHGIELAGCEISQEKDTVKIKQTFRYNGEIDQLSTYVTGKYPVVVLLDGKGILHKESLLTNNENQPIEKQLFPGIDVSDFWVQTSSLQKEKKYVSIGRKDQVKSLITALQENGFLIAACYFGPFAIDLFGSHIQAVNDRIIIPGWELQITDDGLNGLRRTDKEESGKIAFSGEEIDSDVFAVYCSVLDHLTGNNLGLDRNKVPFLIENRIAGKYKTTFFRLVAGGILFFFIVLLSNYILYTSYADGLPALQFQYNKNQKMLEHLSALEKELNTKKEFVKENQITDNKLIAFYCDQVGSIVPSDVHLTKLQVHPLKGRMREDKQLFYDKELIVIEGVTNKEGSLSKWIQQLKTNKWIENVNIEHFYHEGHQVTFILQIKTKWTEEA